MSTIKTTNLQAPSAASPAIVLASDGSATAQLSSLNGGALSGARNRIINGDMRIDQRNAGASVSTSSGSTAYTVDRWQAQYEATSKYTVQQSTDAPAGFTNSLLVTSSSAYTPTATQWFAIAQSIEGLNIADLAWGTANAVSVTVSFRVKSSLTGTFGGSITNAAWSRSYPFSYTISAANTWETKSVTIAGDTTGTWNANTSTGLTLRFNLGTGSTYSGTAGAWAGSQVFAPTGATSVVGTNGATFYITGVQLEAGTVATPFERRSYGQELALCQRYFWTIRGDVDGIAAGIGAGLVRATASEQILYCAYPSTMRASPTLSGATITVESSGLQNSGSLTVAFAGRSSARLGFSVAGLTANTAAMAWLGGSTSAAFLNASAEL